MGVPTADATINQSGYGFSTMEGPVWIGDALYVSELSNTSIPPARIFKITSTGTVSVAIPDSGSNGLATDGKGNIVSANHKAGGIVSFALPSGTATTIVDKYMGTRFISPNDLTIRSDGTIYFTDPNYQGPMGATSQTQTRVYRLPPGATAPIVVDAGLNNPNGITLSLDETKLYVTDTSGLHVYTVAADGSVGAAAPFAQGVVSSGDGMAIDCAGNLYVSVPNSGNVVVVSPSGTSLGMIAVTGVSAVTNAAFGGSDHKTLYITAQGSGGASPSGPGGNSQGVFQVAMPLPGMPY
jgi:gluconolactonase